MTLMQSHVLLQALDLASTALCLELGMSEGNPIAAAMLDAGGLGALAAAKLALVVAVAWALGRGIRRPVAVGRWVLVAVVAGNIAQAAAIVSGA